MTDLAVPITRGQVEDECRIVSEHLGPVRVLHVIGRLDWATAADICDRIRDEDIDPTVIVDIRRAVDVGSADIGALMTIAAEILRRGRQLVFVSDDVVNVEMLRQLQLDRVAPIFGSQAEALNWLGGSPDS
jgi:anti-anti-sigma regulatory factor